MTKETIFVDDNNNIIPEPKTKGDKTMPKTTKVTKTKSATTKVVKTTTKTKAKTAPAPTTTPAQVVTTTTTKRGKKVNKMVEIVASAKDKGYEPVLTGKCLKTITCRMCGKKAVLFTNNIKTILACTCGHREGR